LGPFEVLGIPADSDEAAVRKAFRERAQQLHPDVGGDDRSMAALIEAYRAAVAAVRSPEAQAAVPVGRGARRRPRGNRRAEHDIASFTVDALPVVAFEALHMVASTLGDVSDDNPPYMIEFLVRDAETLWCRCDLVPDAGSTTVAVTVYPAGEEPLVRVDAMRDLLIAELNALDWG
jgi:hypothetical protein